MEGQVFGKAYGVTYNTVSDGFAIGVPGIKRGRQMSSLNKMAAHCHLQLRTRKLRI